MTLLISSILMFGVLHVMPAMPTIKMKLKLKMGKAFGPVYGLATLIALVLSIFAFRSADRFDVYLPPHWGWHANLVLTLIAFLCLGIFVFRGSWRNRLRYPMALGVIIWGIGHLLANGDSGSLVFFGGLMLAAVLHAALVPFVSSDERGGHNLLSIMFGVAFYGVFAQLHSVIAGVPLIQLVK